MQCIDLVYPLYYLYIFLSCISCTTDTLFLFLRIIYCTTNFSFFSNLLFSIHFITISPPDFHLIFDRKEAMNFNKEKKNLFYLNEKNSEANLDDIFFFVPLCKCEEWNVCKILFIRQCYTLYFPATKRWKFSIWLKVCWQVNWVVKCTVKRASRRKFMWKSFDVLHFHFLSAPPVLTVENFINISIHVQSTLSSSFHFSYIFAAHIMIFLRKFHYNLGIIKKRCQL